MESSVICPSMLSVSSSANSEFTLEYLLLPAGRITSVWTGGAGFSSCAGSGVREKLSGTFSGFGGSGVLTCGAGCGFTGSGSLTAVAVFSMLFVTDSASAVSGRTKVSGVASSSVGAIAKRIVPSASARASAVLSDGFSSPPSSAGFSAGACDSLNVGGNPESN